MDQNPDIATARPRRAIQPKDERRSLRRTLGVLALLLGLIVAGGVGVLSWVLYSAQKALDKSTNGHGGSIVQVLFPTSAASESSTRYNVLIAGNSYDDPGHSGGQLTDGIMIASIDPVTSKVALISIPRDLYVEYGGSAMKINAVYPSAGTGDAGLKALSQVAERVTGLHVDNYVLVGVTAFKDMVDAVGGVDVVIKGTDPRGIYDPIQDLLLPAGPQHLDGNTALKLARARNDPLGGKVPYGLADSDYSRQQSQRMLLNAVAQKFKANPTLANPIALVTLFDNLSNTMATDLTASQIRTLFTLVSHSKGDPASITIRGQRGASLLTDYRSKGAGDALVPVAGTFEYGAIQKYVADTLGA